MTTVHCSRPARLGKRGALFGPHAVVLGIVLDLDAPYGIRADDGALLEVRSQGLRCGPAAVMARLAAGQTVGRGEYYFRTLVRLTTGAPQWQHLNQCLVIAVGQRESAQVKLDFYRLT